MKFVAWMAYHMESREIVDDYIARVASYLIGHEFVICENLNSIKREIVDADVLICWKITPEVFACAKKLKWIQFGSAGVDHTIFPELTASKIILTTLSGIHAVPVAEHVIAMMLAMTRRLDFAMKLQIKHRYERTEIAWTAGELMGKTIGIAGLGNIGLAIARMAKAFDMRVVGTKRNLVDSLPNVDHIFSADDMDAMLPEIDYLVVVVPLTQNTREMIGKHELELMKNGSYLVNVARGAMIDHDALGEALIRGKLAGAALDVFPEEPLQSDSPIYDFPNLIMTPHTASSSRRYSERSAEIFRTNFEAFTSGGKMVNVYDRKREY